MSKQQSEIGAYVNIIPTDMDFISYTVDSAENNMAIDECLFLSVVQGYRKSILRVYGWNKPSITIGYFQNIYSLDLHRCNVDNIPVIRRITGGRGVFHLNEITYSIIIKLDNPVIQKKVLFSQLSELIITGLEGMGIKGHTQGKSPGDTRNPNCFESTSLCEIVNEENKKIVGSAMLVRDQVVIMQGSIPLDDSYLRMSEYLNVEDNKKASPIDISEYPYNNLIHNLELFIDSIQKNITLLPTYISDYEREIIDNLYKNKYQTKSWNEMR